MEYSAHYDYYIKFSSITDNKGDIIHYKLANISDNFRKTSKIEPTTVIGKNISELMEEYEDDFIGLKDIYYHLSPNNIRKFEKYVELLDRWYLINIFNNEENILVLYTDITVIKKFLVNTNGRNMDLLSICYRDGLTGLYSKDYFKVELSRLDTERSMPISIIVGDLNGLKMINDAFGYYMGDEAIKTAADIMKKAFRKEDIISRFGGDEFVIILPNTTEEEAMERIGEIKDQFLSLPLDFLQLSMSFGSATKKYSSENIIDVFKRAEEKMYFNKLQESKLAKLKLIAQLKKRLMTTTTETKEHHERLKKLALMLGKEVGISPIEHEELNLLCEYHDIGAVSIPNHIYHKEGVLNDEDWHSIKRHCEIGYHIMKSITHDVSVAEHVLMHHERWDGTGYPRLIKGEEIPLAVRIFTIIDAYEAMVNNRPYRKRLSPEEALEEIIRNSGLQFDPNLSEKFVSLIRNNTNEINIV